MLRVILVLQPLLAQWMVKSALLVEAARNSPGGPEWQQLRVRACPHRASVIETVCLRCLISLLGYEPDSAMNTELTVSAGLLVMSKM